MAFDPQAARDRVEKLWRLQAHFGMERNAYQVYLNELVSDRCALTRGMQVLRDELQFAVPLEGEDLGDLAACAADFSLPSVVTTLANTNCGDRVHQGETAAAYNRVVATRFATVSEIGEIKVESFKPTGGGTDDGGTLAHVTVAHQLDDELRSIVYEGNPRSFSLVAIDLMTHVGRLEEGGALRFGVMRESPWRHPRAACGAVVGALSSYSPDNGVHRRIRRDLGEENWKFLATKKVLAEDGTDVTAAVGAAIVAIKGMRSCLEGLAREMDERGVGHVTASMTVNRVGDDDTIVYLGRGTVFAGEIRLQGLGTQAPKYAAKIVDHHGERRLVLVYDGLDGTARPVSKSRYERPARALPHATRSSDEPLPGLGSTLVEDPKKLGLPRTMHGGPGMTMGGDSY